MEKQIATLLRSERLRMLLRTVLLVAISFVLVSFAESLEDAEDRVINLPVFAGGDYGNMDFEAGDPNLYPRLTYSQLGTLPVGSANSTAPGFDIPDADHGTTAAGELAVESLEPDNLGLGQVIPFLLAFEMDPGSTCQDDCMTFVATWETQAGNSDNFGFDPSLGVIAAFIDTGDPYHIDPDMDATVDNFSWTVVDPMPGIDYIEGTFQVCGVDPGDKLVVEMWLVLDSELPAGGVSGNIQTGLSSAETSGSGTGVCAPGDAIAGSGQQTVPLNQLSKFESAKADVSVMKSDSDDPVNFGDQFSYDVTVTNNSATIVANGVMLTDILDDEVVFISSSISDDQGGARSCTYDGPSHTLTCDLSFLSPGESVVVTIVVEVEATAPTGGDGGAACTGGTYDLENNVSVTSTTDDSDPNNNSDCEPTDVCDLSANPSDAEVCEGNTTDVDGNPIAGGHPSTISNPTHSWTITGGTSSGATLINASSQVVTVDATNATPGTVELEYTVVDDLGCEASAMVTVTVNTEAMADAGMDQTVCGDVVVNIVAMTNGTGMWSGGIGMFGDATMASTTYTPDASEEGSTVTLIWTTDDPDGTGPCEAASDMMTITFTDDATAEAGANQEICVVVGDETVQLNGTIGGGATSATWSGGAGTFSPDANTLDAVYTPDATEYVAGTVVTLTLTTDDPDGPCEAASDMMTITFTDDATAEAGANQEICVVVGDETVQLNGTIGGGATSATWSGGAGTFSPDANTLDAVYTPDATEYVAGTVVTLTLTTDDPDGPCEAASDMISITFTDDATAEAGANQEICVVVGDETVQLNGTIGGGATSATWSGGAGTFSPDANTLDAVYTPDATEYVAGTVVTLTLTTDDPDGPCEAASDMMTITFTDDATAEAGANQEICVVVGDETVQLNGTIGGGATSATWSGGAGTFSPDANTLDAVYTPDATEYVAGTVVTLTLTTDDPDGPCEAASDMMTITFTDDATAEAGANQEICVVVGDETVQLNGTIGGGATSATWSGGAGTFSPDANTLDAVYTPDATEYVAGTVVTLTLTTDDPDGPCEAASDMMTITFTDDATAEAGANQEICVVVGDETVQLNGTIGGGATSATWSGGAGTFSPDANTLDAVYTPDATEYVAGTVVTLTLTTDDPDGPCEAASDMMTITFTDDATAEAGANQEICVVVGDETVQLNGTIGGGATSATWSGGAGTFSPDANTLDAVYTPDATEYVAGTVVTLTLTTDDPDGPCEAASDMMTITFTDDATAEAGANQEICVVVGDETVQLNGTIGGGATSATWSGGAGTFSPDANTLDAVYTPDATEYVAGTVVTLTLTTDDPDGPCEAASDMMTITFTDDATAEAGANQEICVVVGDETVQLNGTIGGGATSATWSGGAGTFSPDANTLDAVYTPDATEYVAGTVVTLTLTTDDPDGPCEAASDMMTITFTDDATAEAGANQEICVVVGDETVQLNGTIGGGATSATWSGGAGTFSPDANTLDAVYTPDATEYVAGTVVTLTLTTDDPDGPCEAASDMMTITFTDDATAEAGANQEICVVVGDETVQLNGTIGGGATSATWSGGAGTFSPDANTLDAVYTPDATEYVAGTVVTLTLTTDDPDGPCEAASDMMTITFTDDATAEAGANQEICVVVGDETVQLNGTIGGGATSATWSGGAGTFSPDANTLDAVYTPDATEYVAGTVVTLTLTTDDPDGPCEAASDMMTITFTDDATAEAGANQEICVVVGDETVQLNGTIGGGATSATWSGGAGTFSPDANTLDAVYTPDATEYVAGTVVTLTLTTDDPDGPCEAASDMMTITFTDDATAEAGANQEICVVVGDETVQLNGTIGGGATSATWSGGAGTFSPDANTLDAVYTPDATEYVAGTVVTLTLTTDDPDGPCEAASDMMTITFTDDATAEAGANQEICVVVGDETVQLNGTIGGGATSATWSGGAGTFSPDANTLDAVYTPDATEYVAGTVVTLTLTTDDPDGPCEAASDMMTITFTDDATAEAGANQEICVVVGDETVQLNGTIGGGATSATWSGGAGTFSPDANTLDAVYTPDATEYVAGTVVTLTLTTDDPDGPCEAASDMMTITFTDDATAEAGANQEICVVVGDETVQLNGTIGGGATSATWSGGAGTFSPDANTLDAVYTPDATEYVAGTVVTLTLTTDDPDGPCEAASDMMTITFTDDATAEAGANQEICVVVGDETVQLNGTIGGGATSATWSGGAGTFSPDANTLDAVYTPDATEYVAGTVVTLTLTTDDPDGPCEAASDMMTITFTDDATAEAGANQEICVVVGDETVQLNGTIGGGATSATWSGGAGTFSPDANTLDAVYTPDATEYVAGTVVTLTLTTDDPDGPCEAASDMMTITFTDDATAEAGANQEICVVVGDETVQLNGTIGGGATSATWSGGAGTFSPDANTLDAVYTPDATEYVAGTVVTLTLTTDDPDGPCEAASDMMTITFTDDATAEAGANQEICVVVGDETVQLNGTIGGGATSATWSGGAGTFSPDANTLDAVYTPDATEYVAGTVVTLTLTTDDPDGPCEAASDMMTITFTDDATAEAGANQEICVVVGDETVQLNGTIGGGATSATWSGGAGTFSPDANTLDAVYTPDATEYVAGTVVTLTLTTDDPDGPCEAASDMMTITFTDDATAEAGANQEICVVVGDETVQLNGTIGGGATSATWSGGAGTFSPDANTLDAVYTPDATEYVAGTVVTLTLTTDDPDGPCEAASDMMTITFTDDATAEAGANQEICVVVGDETVQLNGTIGGGATSATWSGGAGTFSPDANTLDAVYTPDATEYVAGTVVTLTLTTDDPDGPCEAASDMMTITFTDDATAEAGANQEICVVVGDETVQLNGTIGGGATSATWSGGAGTFSPDANTLDAVYTPDATEYVAGTVVTLTLTTDDPDGPCEAASDMMTITFTDDATAEAGANQEICVVVGDETVQLNGTIGGGATSATWSGGAGTFSPDANTLDAVYTPDATEYVAGTVVTLTLTTDDPDGPCEAASDMMTITFTDDATAEAGANQEICVVVGDETVQLNGTIGGGATSATWSGGAGTFSPDANTLDAVYTPDATEYVAGTVVTLTLTTDDPDGPCEAASDMMTITFTDDATAEAGANQEICVVVGDETVQLNGTIGGGATSATWSGGAGTFSPDANTLDAVYTPDATEYVAGTVVTLTLTTDDPDGPCEAASDMMTITFTDDATAEAGANQEICVVVGDETVQLNGTIGGGATSATWSGGAGTFSPDANTLDAVYTPDATEYVAGTVVTLTLTTDDPDGPCEAASDMMTITFTDDATAEAGANQEICVVVGDETVQLNGTIGGGATSATWSGGAGTFSPDANTLDAVYTPDATEYVAGTVVTLTLTTDDPDGPCEAASDMMTITFTDDATAEAGANQEICVVVGDETVQLNGTIGGGATSATWSGGAGTFSPDANTLDAVYTPDATEYVAGTVVTLTLTTDDPDGPCEAASDMMTITFTDDATAEAGANQEICVVVGDETVQLNGTIGGGATSATWSGGAGTFSPDANTLDAVYTPDATEYVAGTVVTLTLTTDDPDGPCEAASDMMTITFTDDATAEAGANQEICVVVGDETVQLNGTIGGGATSATWSGGAGTFSPDANTLDAVYTPDATEYVAGTVVTLTLTTDDPDGPCEAASDMMTITFTDDATAEAGANQEICVVVGDETVQLNGTIGGGATSATWSGGAGTFSPDANTLDAVYTPDATEYVAGTVVTLTLTTDDPDGPCEAASDMMTITFTDDATAEAGANQEICVVVGDETVQLNGTIGGGATSATWSGGAGTFSPDANTLDAVYTPDATEYVAGTVVTLTLTTDDPDGPCEAASDMMTITFTDDATAEAGANQEICVVVGDETVQLNGTIGGGATSATWSGGAGTFSPDANTLDAVYTPDATEYVAGTVVTLTLTTDDPDGPCEAASDMMTITFTDDATAEAGANQEICVVVGDETVQLNGTIGGGATSATWSGGAGTFSPDANTLDAVYTPDATEYVAGTVVTLTLTTDDPDGPCEAASDMMTITFTDDATAEAGANQEICVVVGDETVQLNGTIGGGATSATWSGGAGTFSPDANTLDAVYTPDATEYVAGTVVTLTLTTDDPDGPCEAASDMMTITFTDDATAEAGANQEICVVVGDETVQLNGTIGGGATSATWSGGAGTFSPDANTLDAVYTPDATEYVAGTVVTLTLTTDDPDGPCEAASDMMTITFTDDATAEAGANQEICVVVGDETVQLNGTIGGGATSATWSGGAGTFSPDANTLDAVYTPDATEYVAGTVVTLTLTTDDPDGPCEAASDMMTITFTDDATAEAGANQEICVVVGDETVQLNGTIGGGATSATWSGGAGTFSPDANTLDAVYTPDATEYVAGTVVTLTLTTDDPDGPCEAASDMMTITFTDDATAEAGANQEICVVVGDETVQLNGTIGGGATSATWSGGAGTFSPDANTLDAVYTPDATEYVAGTVVTLTLTTDDPDGPCEAASDMMTITFTDDATAEAGANQEICVVVGDETVQLNGTIGGGATSATWSGGAGTFSPDANTLDAVYTPDATEYVAGTVVTLTLTTDDPDGPCEAASDMMTITFTDDATAEAGANQEICVVVGDETVQLNGTIGGGATSATWSGGAGTFSPDANTLDAVYTPDATEYVAGTVVTLTLTTDDPDGPCEAASDMMTITFTDDATAEAGANQEICVVVGDETVQLNGTIGGGATSATWSGGAGTFSPDANTLDAVYTPDATEYVAGTVVTLTLTTDDPDGPCEAASDMMTVTINQLTCSITQLTCDGISAMLSAEPQGGTSPYTYLWSTGENTQTIDVFVNGTYSVAVTDDNGCTTECDITVVCINREDCCDGGRNKPKSITLRYTGEDCSATTTNQSAGVHSCVGDPAFDPSVYILVTNKDPNGGNVKVWFEGPVNLGGTFTADAANAGESRLRGETYVSIYADMASYEDGEDPLQQVEFHTSCSEPVAVGDQYGASLILSIMLQDGTVCGDIPDPELAIDLELTKRIDNPSVDVGGVINFSLRVTNAGNVVATNVVVRDDLPSGFTYVSHSGGLFGPGGEIIWEISTLDPGEEILLQLSAIVEAAGSHVNTAQVVDVDQTSDPDSEPDNDDPTEDDQDDVEWIPGGDPTDPRVDCCDGGGNKPSTITFKYTGQDCSHTNTSQSPGVYSCTDSDDEEIEQENSVYIIASNKNPNGGNVKIWFVGQVNVDETFTISSQLEGASRLSGNTVITIYKELGGAILQTVNFHTSCSEPIAVGDQYGANLITGIQLEDGTICDEVGSTPAPIVVANPTTGGQGKGKGKKQGKSDAPSPGLEGIQVTAYPNPASNYVNLEFSGITDDKIIIQVYDALGRKVLEEKVGALDAMPIRLTLPEIITDGMHYIRIKNDSEIKAIPIVVTKARLNGRF